MNSNWEIGKEISNYHHDKWRDEVPGYTHQKVGQFIGDWEDELQDAYTKMKPITWPSRWDKYGKKDSRGIENLKEAELNDLINAGADPDMHMYQGLLDLGPTLSKMVDSLALKNVRHKLHIQQTGNMVVTHFDKHYEYGDDNNTRRFLIALADWEPGQFVMFGNDVITWQKGDIITFDWVNIPHSTANASLHLRPLLQVTGVMTNLTHSILEKYTIIEL